MLLAKEIRIALLERILCHRMVLMHMKGGGEVPNSLRKYYFFFVTQKLLKDTLRAMFTLRRDTVTKCLQLIL